MAGNYMGSGFRGQLFPIFLFSRIMGQIARYTIVAVNRSKSRADEARKNVHSRLLLRKSSVGPEYRHCNLTIRNSTS